MPRLVIATNNVGKRDEMRVLLARIPELREFDLVTMREAGFADWDPEETGADFAQNATIKARGAAALSGAPALADDSGLCIDALDGAPGLRSARWLGADASSAQKNEAILERMAEIAPPARGAHFICALALALPTGEIDVREGFLHGSIADSPIGEEGFGYDPIFLPRGESRTLAQMTLAEKNMISHRRAAWNALAPAARVRLKKLCDVW